MKVKVLSEGGRIGNIIYCCARDWQQPRKHTIQPPCFIKKREKKQNNYIKQPFHVQSGSLYDFTHTSHHSRSICSQLLCIIVFPEIGALALCGGGGTVSPVHCPVLFFFYCFPGQVLARCTWLVLIAWESTEGKDSPVSLPPMTTSDSSP